MKRPIYLISTVVVLTLALAVQAGIWHRQNVSKNTEIVTLQQSLRQAEQQNRQLRSRVGQLEGQYEQALEAVSGLKAQQDDITNMSQQLIEQLQNSLQELKAEVARSTAELQSLQSN